MPTVHYGHNLHHTPPFQNEPGLITRVVLVFCVEIYGYSYKFRYLIPISSVFPKEIVWTIPLHIGGHHLDL